MPRKYPTLATAEEIRTIARRSMALMESLHERDEAADEEAWNDPDARQLEHQVFRGAKEAMRFCAAAAGLLGDASLLQLIGTLLHEQEGWDDHADRDTDVIVAGLRELLRKGAPVNDSVEAFASHTNDDIRAAIADGLRPTNARAIKLLEKLARDPIAAVRKPAQAALASRGELPWWGGKFQRDPLASLSEGDASALREPIEQISAMLDQSRYALMNQDRAFAELAAKLPDAIALDVIELVLSSGSNYETKMPATGAYLLSREGGVEVFIRVLKGWAKHRAFFLMAEHKAMLENLPGERATAASLALAKYALSAPAKVRDEISTSYYMAAELAAHGAHEGTDLSPFVEMILAAPEAKTEGRDLLIHKVAEVLAAKGAVPGALSARLLEARLAGYPGAWSRMGMSIDKLLHKAPLELLRPAAEQALRSDDDKLVRWGMQFILTAAHVPETDGTQLELAGRLCEDPRLRTLVAGDHVLLKMAIAPLRVALRRGELAWDVALNVISTISTFWGGLAPTFVSASYWTDEKIETSRKKQRDEHASTLGPEELHGPVTEEEWAAVRKGRDATVPNEYGTWFRVLCTLPEGPWHPADRALLDRALEAFETDPDLAMPISTCLTAKATIEDLPLFDRLIERATDHRALLRSNLYSTRERLGLPKKPEGDTAKAEAASGDWMDEDDE